MSFQYPQCRPAAVEATPSEAQRKEAQAMASGSMMDELNGEFFTVAWAAVVEGMRFHGNFAENRPR
jgi:hypothetical protein